MRQLCGQLTFSATDLSRFLACGHLTNLRRELALGLRERPRQVDDPRTELLRRRGIEHEERLLAAYRDRGLRVEAITETDAPDGGDRDAARVRTVEAMRRGADVIYQGRLEHGRWSGYPDFLLRVDAPSALGAWSYEVVDAKLARIARGEALLQLLLYSDLLQRVQAAAPEHMHLALGGAGGRFESFRIAEHAAYYRVVRQRFEAHVDAPPETRPEPVAHCELCDWQQDCRAHWRSVDHLSLVAGISVDQRRRLTGRGVDTLAALATVPLPATPRIDGIDAAALARIREQARVQLEARQRGRRIRELITPVAADKGLASLPAPSRDDIFAAIQGDVYTGDDGLEYLFGFVDREGRHDARWALDKHTERCTFEQFIDGVMDRWQREPGFHIYHYGPAAPAAVRRLMSRYATREDAVDRLLRGNVFVDLRRAVRQGLRASVESYALTRLEPFYGFERQVDLAAAIRARVRFEAWLESGNAGDRPDRPDDLRGTLARCNRDDCRSALRLADWLEACRRKLESEIGQPLPRPAADAEARDAEYEQAAEVAALIEALTAGLPPGDDELDDDQRARRLLAHLLEFHRREDKSMWWEFFERCGFTAEEHVEDSSTLGGLRWTGEEPLREKRSFIHRYRYPAQPHEIEVGDAPRDPATGKSAGTVVALDDAAGVIELKRGVASDAPDPFALVPLDHVNARVLAESLQRLALAVADGGSAPDSPRLAAFDLLRRSAPRTAEAAPATAGTDLVHPGETPLEAVQRIAPLLDRAVLPVQGPPGSGKTYAGARMILDLLARGRRVGVTANSHKVISNLLGAVCQAAREQGVDIVRGIQKANAGDGCFNPHIEPASTNDEVAYALASGRANLAGGTAWLWARPEMAGAVDLLVIDEAGQMSLANTLAVSQAAGSLVLLGDPRQLDQPIQGIHPPGADTSALGHLLGESATVDPARGVFLAETWRMHPDICAFTTEQFYDGRLAARPELARQQVLGTGPLAGRGLRLVRVEHAGNTKASAEEASRVAALMRELLEDGGAWVDRHGARAALTLEDILVVAPYNAHVAALRRALPDGARVGTVDKFQGQEAPIVLYSMATSTPDEAPRGMAFLYSLHRLNVATSRARCVAAIVASPALFTPDCRTPEQMRLANPFCRFREMAAAAPTQA